VHGLDRLPRLNGGLLHDQRHHHLLWHDANNGIQRHSVLMQRDTTRLNGLPEIPRLYIDLHDQGPLGVVHLEEKRSICWPDVDLPNDTLDGALAATAARSTLLAGRNSQFTNSTGSDTNCKF
jgi:hypothetical protein